MTNDPFITFKEAADLLGDVSKKTIERFYKREKDNPEYADAFEHRPDAKGAKFFIRKSIALQTEFKQGSTGKSSTADNSDVVREAIHELTNQLQVKDQQLATKDQQLVTKDKQIESLQENLKNEQILHLRAQEKARPFIKSLLMLTSRKNQEEGMPDSVPNRPISGRKVRTGFLITFTVAFAVLIILIIVKIILSYFF
ncbi:hypothetical protein Pan241w_35630 [Gimesia alba]|uniref:Chromosome partition protein Smc n=1 Tax=Gimesia alba TaxID=2527973 RepID=A0A517RHW6_9PLAN|nr:hypothetical protein [Gimesia alba]QDT43462.1 hypothetical protein Pan241w_35630 [Gimesia alba]